MFCLIKVVCFCVCGMVSCFVCVFVISEVVKGWCEFILIVVVWVNKVVLF